MLAIAAEEDWEVLQLDEKNIYEDKEEDVFVEMTPRFEATDKKGVRHVRKLGNESVRVSSKPSEVVEDHRPALGRNRICVTQIRPVRMQSRP